MGLKFSCLCSSGAADGAVGGGARAASKRRVDALADTKVPGAKRKKKSKALQRLKDARGQKELEAETREFTGKGPHRQKRERDGRRQLLSPPLLSQAVSKVLARWLMN